MIRGMAVLLGFQLAGEFFARLAQPISGQCATNARCPLSARG